MTFIAKNTGGGDFELIPAGTHLAICYLLVDLGQQQTNFGIKHQIMLGWELSNELMEDGRPFAITNTYTLSLNEKANLRKHLESWRGAAFTEEEAEGFDVSNILGAHCMLSVIHNSKDNKTYSNISAISATVKGMEVPQRVNDMVAYDIDEPNDLAFKKLPEWIQKKIMGAVSVPHGGEEHDELNPPPQTEQRQF